jgi:membrane-bound serine protease (ClpP class)
MIIGSLMLFESPAPFMRLSLYVILPAVIITTLFFTLIIGLAVKAHRRKPVTGIEGLIGAKGVANTDITKDGGMVLLHGERWAAYSDEPISKGEKIIVEAVSELKVKVKKLK